MKIIADTNTFIAVALGEPERDSIVEATLKAKLVSPEILPYEIGNAISKMVRKDLIPPSRANEIFKTTQYIPVELRAISISEAIKISLKFKIYSYDAYFLECAIENNAPILSLDRQMLRIAKELKINVVELS